MKALVHDGHGNIVQTETTVTETFLYITVSHKTVDEMAAMYGFNQEQKDYLAELLQEDKGMNDAQSLGGTILTFCARWSLILSGDETPLPDFADNTEVKFDE